jgi:redox-sensitive bicupin YhaK (pirin superfamily)
MANAILQTAPLGAPPWPTADPFLFCVHHDDAYPAGNEAMGPAASLEGRNLGMDFEGKDGWRMYHGEVIPGFPQHPHRGFETVTIVRRGFIDHSDSLGATARFGAGDAQWLTAGEGIVHSEMFPLLDDKMPNHLELFQIWLNLPAKDKLAKPHFAMLWSHDIPSVTFTDEQGKKAEVFVYAGALDGHRAPPPPPRSWGARPDSDLAIWSIRLEPGASWTVPKAASEATRRTLYFFRGEKLKMDDRLLSTRVVAAVRSDVPLHLEAIDGECELLLLQGRPIGEPVAQHGPFVMNTRAEIEAAMADYRRTRFGGWPFSSDAPVHPREEGRFARHADGKVERKAR